MYKREKEKKRNCEMFVNSLKGDDAPPQTVERRWEKKKESTGRGPVDPFGPFEDGGGTSRG